MSVRGAIANCTATFTPAERRIAEALLGRSDQVRDLPARRVGELLGLHESAVIRFAQKVGYSGYRDLRADLSRDGNTGERPSLTGKGERSSLREVAQTQAQILAELPELIPQPTLDAAATMLLEARHIDVVGSGLMEALATFTERKLALLGLAATALRLSGPDLVERLSTVRDEDAVLAFGFGSDIARIAPLLSELGLTTRSALVTDESALLVGGLPAHVFTLPRATVRHGVLVPALVVAYALEYALIRQDPGRVAQAETRVERLKRARLRGAV